MQKQIGAVFNFSMTRLVPVLLWLVCAAAAFGHVPEPRPFHFDAANRLATNTTPLGRQATFTYDPRGVVRTRREPSGMMTTNSYDERARLTNRVDGAGGIAYAYDAGNLLLTVKEGARTLTRTYDSVGRLETFTDGNTNQLRYHYDASGNLIRLQYPDGKAVTYSYDGRNQLTNATDWAGRKTAFLYDLNGRVMQILRPNGTKRIVAYDEAAQMTRIEERDAQNHLIALFRYGYNAVGEITNRFAVPVPGTNALPLQKATHDFDNRLATFADNLAGSNPLTVTHDLDGNLTSGPITNRTANTYAWDARNRLKSAGGLSYTYDAENNRTAITNAAAVTRFVVNPSPALSQVLVRIKPDGSQTFYVHGLGLLYEAATNGTTRTYHYDYLGSTVAITDDNGQVTDRAEYSPYASLTYRTGNTDTPFLFNGRYGVMTDANGLLHMRARYYNPYLARFVSEDPIGFAGGMNFYAYADGNPISLLDPFGLGAEGADGYRQSYWFQVIQAGVHGAEESADAMLNFGLGVFITPQYGSPPRLDPIQNLTSMLTGRVAYQPSPWNQAMNQVSADLVPAGQNVILSVGGRFGTTELPTVAARNAPANVLPSSGGRFMVDSRGNTIPLRPGETFTSSPNAQWIQVRDAAGNPTGLRLDGPHSLRTHPDPRAQVPHGHVPGVTNPDGTPWLPVNR